MIQFGVEAARQNFQFCRIESALNPALPVLFGINENSVELPIEPMHVTPCHAFKKTVLSKDPNVLGEIGVIDAAGLEIEHLSREQCGQTNRTGRTNNDLGEPFPLDVIQHLQNWRETQFLQFVFRQLKFADGREVFDWDIRELKVAS